MVGGILADIWVSKERNTAMVLFTGATLFGTGLGPLLSGLIAEKLLWRWVFYVQIIFSGLLVGLVVVFFEETRGTTILSKKTRAVNKWYEELEAVGALGMRIEGSGPNKHESQPKRLRYIVMEAEARTSIIRVIGHSLYRPIHMLFTEPVVFL